MDTKFTRDHQTLYVSHTAPYMIIILIHKMYFKIRWISHTTLNVYIFCHSVPDMFHQRQLLLLLCRGIRVLTWRTHNTGEVGKTVEEVFWCALKTWKQTHHILVMSTTGRERARTCTTSLCKQQARDTWWEPILCNSAAVSLNYTTSFENPEAEWRREAKSGFKNSSVSLLSSSFII